MGMAGILPFSLNKNHAILFLVGCCLSIAQFVMIRDFVAILYGEEVVIALVTGAFFFGLSLGYLFSTRIPRQAWAALFVFSVFLHLTFPYSYRYLAAGISASDIGGAWFMVLLFTFALFFNSAFTTFLPRLIDLPDAGSSAVQRLRACYSVELLGFAAGFAAVAWSWNRPLSHLLPVYWVLLGAILCLVLKQKAPKILFFVLLLIASGFLDKADKDSTALLYEQKHGKRNARVLLSINSAYQKVEVIEDSNNERYLYLDGLQNLNATDLAALNYYIAAVPAHLIHPQKTLIIGNGTLSSVAKVYPLSGAVVSVELDSGVLAAGRRFFTAPGTLADLARWRLVVDDGKHFLMTTEERFDLIVMDIPSPLAMQEAILHTLEFYRLARRRLRPGGVLAVQLSGPLQQNNRTPARVTAALQAAFPEVMAVYSEKAGRGFAYAADDLPFTPQDVQRETASYESTLQIIPAAAVPDYLQNARPLALDNLDLVLRRGWERFSGRYFDDD